MIETAETPRTSLLPLRLFYFFTGTSGFLAPFLSLFYVHRGLSGTQIGWLGTIGAVTALLAAPLWGRWSDRVTHPRTMLQMGILGAAAANLVLSQTMQFYGFAVIVLVHAMIVSGIEPISDTLAVNAVENDQKSGFGSIRVWASLGWAAASLIGGWLIERTSLFAAFAADAGGAVCSAAALAFIPSLRSKPQRSGRPVPETRELVRRIRTDPIMVGLAIALALHWLTRKGTYQFEAVYLQQLGAGETLIGLTSTLGALPELFAMFWADSLVRKFGSHRVLQWGVLLFGLTTAGVVLLPTIPVIISMRTLSGLSFSFYWVALIELFAERSPLKQTATTLALYLVTLRELVSMVGSPLSGLVFDALGAYWLYAFATGGAVLSWWILRWSAGARGRERIG